MSIGPITLRVARTTGTHGDVLLAAGVADLLQSASDAEVRLSDDGTAIFVHVPTEVPAADLPADPGYPFLKTKADQRAPAGVREYDYQELRERAQRFSKSRKHAARGGPELAALADEDRPPEVWRHLQVLNTMQGDETTNRVCQAIAELSPDAFRSAVMGALQSLAKGLPSGLTWPATGVQLFSPNAAKGYCLLKPNGTGRNDKTKENWVDPFQEWLKYRGYFSIACPFFEGDKNIRLLCPVPGDIAFTSFKEVAARLNREGVYGGPPKMDALAVLRLAMLLIRHSEEYAAAPKLRIPGLKLAGTAPGKVISEIQVTQYQSLGQSRAIAAMFRLAVPAWFDIHSEQDAQEWLDILGEHEAVVRALRDDHSDEIGLLVAYRRFLERRGPAAATALVEFLGQYGPFLLRAREQGRRIRAFQTDRMERIVVANDASLAEILDNPGFKAVAAAVRRSTVSAQALKAMRVQNYREIRYDLLPDLRRKRSLPGTPFIEAVAEFISLYNAENARRRELGMSAPANVTTEELQAFTELVDTRGSALVGALLCAYGSCREPREPEAAEPEVETSDLEPDTDKTE